MSLTCLAAPFQEKGWREALRAFFIAVADELPVFYASAEVVSGMTWTGRSLYYGLESESTISPAWGGTWSGLPPKPTWWSWLGGPMLEHGSSLPTDRTTATARGILYEASEHPSGAAHLTPLSDWLPPDLFSQLTPNPQNHRPPPLVSARTIPAALRPAAQP